MCLPSPKSKNLAAAIAPSDVHRHNKISKQTRLSMLIHNKIKNHQIINPEKIIIKKNQHNLNTKHKSRAAPLQKILAATTPKGSGYSAGSFHRTAHILSTANYRIFQREKHRYGSAVERALSPYNQRRGSTLADWPVFSFLPLHGRSRSTPPPPSYAPLHRYPLLGKLVGSLDVGC